MILVALTILVAFVSTIVLDAYASYFELKFSHINSREYRRRYVDKK